MVVIVVHESRGTSQYSSSICQDAARHLFRRGRVGRKRWTEVQFEAEDEDAGEGEKETGLEQRFRFELGRGDCVDDDDDDDERANEAKGARDSLVIFLVACSITFIEIGLIRFQVQDGRRGGGRRE